ncbi:F-box domain [Arabidopsis suecica]|uniref:F-box domain n=1 Tax=Arabidopsis suecica TaxID=45249 RepID=A0A8T2CHQ3_ARASU|nr:F-box domain [Arabidopsis suecica]
MKRGENLESIPTDLIMEIFSRLPAKSVARFRTLSKLWGSMLYRPYFTELFLTRSFARPRLLFLVQRFNDNLFFSSPQPQNRYDKSSLVVAATFHMKFLGNIDSYVCSCGLIYFHGRLISKKEVRVICNPITAKYAILPKLTTSSIVNFLGFDPIDKQYKVLIMKQLPYDSPVHHILTLETGQMRWRRIQCPLIHGVCCKGICINGVLYYLACEIDKTSQDQTYLLVCFDVRSEKFKFVDAKCSFDNWSTTMINYKGKLGVINWKYGIELNMWVLEDMEKHEWSKYVYTFPENNKAHDLDLGLDGVTAAGEIVFSSWKSTCKPFYVFYYNPGRNTLHNVEIQGFVDIHEEPHCRFYTTVDYVEDLSVNDAKQLNSSIYASSMKNKRSLNIITNERDNREDEERRIRRRRHRHKRRDRDDHWSDKQYKKRMERNWKNVVEEEIQCLLNHDPFPLCDGICINGVLYYLAERFLESPCVIVCFDVRDEKFKFIDAKCFGADTTLINYKGKLGALDYEYDKSGGSLNIDQLLIDLGKVSVVGMTATCDIVLANHNTCKPFYVYYFNPERNTFTSLEIQGFGDNLETLENCGGVFAFLDHVEDLNVNDAKHFKSSRVNKGLNIIRKRPKPPQRLHTSRDSRPLATLLHLRRTSSRQASCRTSTTY